MIGFKISFRIHTLPSHNFCHRPWLKDIPIPQYIEQHRIVGKQIIMGTCCICLRSRSVRNVPKCKVDLTLCLRCFFTEIWCGIKVGVGLVIGRRLIRAQISMKNTLTAMSKTPEMSQVRLPCRQEGKGSAGNWAWTLNNELCQKRKEKKTAYL